MRLQRKTEVIILPKCDLVNGFSGHTYKSMVSWYLQNPGSRPNTGDILFKASLLTSQLHSTFCLLYSRSSPKTVCIWQLGGNNGWAYREDPVVLPSLLFTGSVYSVITIVTDLDITAVL